jgi:protein dithiol oxidoreductase (disulfide-forming)
MPLNRRDFSAGWLGGVALLGAVPTASAQGKAPVEGVNYVRLEQRVPATVPGKIEVIEFFWYECPHCNAFEPALEAWEKALPADVVLHRVPVWFREEPFTAQQKLYYALDGMGLVPSMQRRVFYAIHNDHVRLRTAEDISAFALKNGIDPLKFMPIYNSFSVQTQAQRARQIAAAYKIDAVPAMGVQGRFYTNGSLASANGAVTTPTGTNERMLVVVDSLIARIRQGA